MTNRVLTLAAVAAVVFGISGTARAQSGTTDMPTFELGAGYQFLHLGEICSEGEGEEEEDCGSSQSLPFGLAVDAVRNFGAMGIVGEFGWSRDSETFTLPLGLGEISSSVNVFHVAGGVRWTSRSRARVWPYGQVLAGAAVNRFSEEDFDGSEFSDTATRFMLQPGVGATFVAGDGWGVFGQVDYRRLFLKDDDGASGRNDVRVFVGARMILD